MSGYSQGVVDAVIDGRGGDAKGEQEDAQTRALPLVPSSRSPGLKELSNGAPGDLLLFSAHPNMDRVSYNV